MEKPGEKEARAPPTEAKNPTKTPPCPIQARPRTHPHPPPQRGSPPAPTSISRRPKVDQPPTRGGSAAKPKWISPRPEVDQPLIRGRSAAKPGWGGCRTPSTWQSCRRQPTPNLPQSAQSAVPPSPSIRSCAGPAHASLCARCVPCDCPPSSFMRPRVPLREPLWFPPRRPSGPARAPPAPPFVLVVSVVIAHPRRASCPPVSPFVRSVISPVVHPVPRGPRPRPHFPRTRLPGTPLSGPKKV